MSHIDPDTLTAYALDVLDETNCRTVRDHLAVCAECTASLSAAKADTDRLGSVRLPVIPLRPPPLRVRKRMPAPWMRAAAILAIGFLAGFLTAEALKHDPVIVVHQEFRPAAVPPTEAARASCQPVDIVPAREL